jgi:hypothetical protein
VVLRAAGEVGCAHCHAVGAADHTCQVCRLQVCGRCAADWSTCDQPSGRVVRLGLTARVRDVDPLGRVALVSHWRKPLRTFDLRTLSWRSGELPRALYLWTRAFPPRLTSDERLIRAEVYSNAETAGFLFVAFRSRSLADGSEIELWHQGAPLGHTGVSAQGDVYWYVNDEQRIVVIARPPGHELPASTAPVALAKNPAEDLRASTCFTYEPLPRKVMQAVHVDGERQLLASASWSEVALHRMDAGKLARLGHVTTALPGDVLWIGVGGPYVAAVVFEASRGTHVEVRRLGTTNVVGDIALQTPPQRGFSTAAISRDGRYLAIAWGARLDVHDLDSGTHEMFDEHTERINALRFAADDHMLISADTDNRLILRPRTPAGHARPLIAVEPHSSSS